MSVLIAATVLLVQLLFQVLAKGKGGPHVTVVGTLVEDGLNLVNPETTTNLVAPMRSWS